MGAGLSGFLGALGGAAQKKADQTADDLHEQKKQKASIYWKVINNPDSQKAEVDEANAQLDKLYPKDPQIKQIFDKFRSLHQQTHPAHQGGAGDTVPKGEPNVPGAIPPPPRPDVEAPGASGNPRDMSPMQMDPRVATPSPQGGGAAIPPPPQPGGGAAQNPQEIPNNAIAAQGKLSPTAPTATGTIATPPFLPDGKSAIPPPPKPPSFADLAHRAGGPSTKDKQDEWDRQEKVKHQYKMEEQEAAAKAKAANPTGAARATSPTSISRAKELSKSGVTFKSADPAYADEDGNINVDELPEDMMLVPLQQNGKLVGYIPASQKQKIVRWNGQVHAVPEFDLTKEGAGTVKGLASPGTVTESTDPATQQTTRTVKTPIIPGAAKGASGGAKSGAGPAPTAPGAAAPGTAPPSAKSAPGTGTSQTPPAAPTATGPSGVASLPTPKGLPPLDADERIPAVAGSPQVVEGANQLLHSERDVKDLPAKTRELSASMARKYGWDENAFTPLERRQVGVAAHFVDRLLANPNLDTLDDDFISQLPMLGATSDVSKEGFFGKIGTKLASKHLTDEQADFLRDYRQLASVISGLGKLSRGGRVTESTVTRLLNDLPNPTNTKDSKDAKKRLMLLKDEIKVAMDNGTFEQLSGKSKPSTRKSAISAPPKPGDVSAGQLSQAAKDYLKSQGVPVE